MSEEAAFLSLFGFNLAPTSYLAGGKRAIRVGNTVYVSPAMFDLIRHADERELRLLLENIELRECPEPPSIYDIPLTTMPPMDFDAEMRRRITMRYGI